MGAERSGVLIMRCRWGWGSSRVRKSGFREGQRIKLPFVLLADGIDNTRNGHTRVYTKMH